MKVEEYNEKVQELLKAANGYISGIKLSKETNIRMNITSINGNPALVLCEVNDKYEPTKIAYCIEISDIPTARALQIWLGDALGTLAHKELQGADISSVNADADDNNNTKEDNTSSGDDAEVVKIG